MKKLLMITLSLLLFTILISPVQAKRSGPLDRPLPDYNNLTLRQIFEDGQLILNGDFDTVITPWSSNGSATTLSIENATLKAVISSVQGYAGIIQVLSVGTLITANTYYIRGQIKPFRTHYLSIHLGGITFYTGVSVTKDIWNTYSYLKTLTNVTTQNFVIYENGNVTTEMDIGDITYHDTLLTINLTALGIPTATKIEMDNLYSDYVKYKDMMNATDVMLIVGQLGAFVWSLVVSFEVFGFVLWEYALFGIGAGFIGYLALKIIQKKAGDDNGDSD